MLLPASRVMRRPAIWLAVLACAVALAAYQFGRTQQRHDDSYTVTGNAYVGLHQASMVVDGWAYGVQGSVRWYDRTGAGHGANTWPTCLSRPGSTVRTTFGIAVGRGPHGDEERAVTYVVCR